MKCCWDLRQHRKFLRFWGKQNHWKKIRKKQVMFSKYVVVSPVAIVTVVTWQWTHKEATLGWSGAASPSMTRSSSLLLLWTTSLALIASLVHAKILKFNLKVALCKLKLRTNCKRPSLFLFQVFWPARQDVFWKTCLSTWRKKTTSCHWILGQKAVATLGAM